MSDEPRRFSRAEVAGNARRLLVVGRLVLDVAALLAPGAHPGGAAVLQKLVGGDATSAFLALGHSQKAQAQALSLAVGRLADGE